MPGGSCNFICKFNDAGKVCDPDQQVALGGILGKEVNDAVVAAGGTCDNYPTPGIVATNFDPAPYILKQDGEDNCFRGGMGADSSCNLRGNNDIRRLCCCVPKGTVGGDPHIDTLRGEHYTLLQSGNFLAWSFAKQPAEWQIFAAYSGARVLVKQHERREVKVNVNHCQPKWRDFRELYDLLNLKF